MPVLETELTYLFDYPRTQFLTSFHSWWRLATSNMMTGRKSCPQALESTIPSDHYLSWMAWLFDEPLPKSSMDRSLEVSLLNYPESIDIKHIYHMLLKYAYVFVYVHVHVYACVCLFHISGRQASSQQTLFCFSIVAPWVGRHTAKLDPWPCHKPLDMIYFSVPKKYWEVIAYLGVTTSSNTS